MKPRILIFIAVALLAVSAAVANEPDGCPPLGQPLIGPLPPYDHIANGNPSYDSCWTKWAATFTTDYDSCGNWRNFWEFGYGGSLTQTLTIPSDHHITTLRFSYLLDFDDPHHDAAWNQFSSRVTDTTAGRILGGESRNGSSPSLYCSNRRLTLTSPVDLAGHTIQVRFTGSKGYSDTHIRVRQIALTE